MYDVLLNHAYVYIVPSIVYLFKQLFIYFIYIFLFINLVIYSSIYEGKKLIYVYND